LVQGVVAADGLADLGYAGLEFKELPVSRTYDGVIIGDEYF
jgi:hypothetical protein